MEGFNAVFLKTLYIFTRRLEDIPDVF